MIRIYLAGPLSLGDMTRNVRQGIDAAETVLMLGCAPYVPHLSHFWSLVHPHAYEEWMQLDFAWLAACQAVWRLPGLSHGTEREVTYAHELGMPVFTELSDLKAWLDQPCPEKEDPC